MRRSLSDVLAYLGGPKVQTHPHSEVLRARAALSFGMQSTGTTLTQFNREFIEPVVGGADSKIGFKWWNGANIPSRASIAKLDRQVPGILAVFSHDMFALLRDEHFPVKKIERILRQWRPSVGRGAYWCFGDEAERHRSRRVGTVAFRDSFQQLFERGDIPGFSVILGLMRAYEAQGITDTHIECAKYAYRYFPTIARIPWMKPHQKLLRYCLQHVHMRDLVSFLFVGVNWTVIKFQIGLERHEVDSWRLQEEWLVPPFDPVWERLWLADNREIADPLRPHPGRRSDWRAFLLAAGRRSPRSKNHPRNRGEEYLFIPKSFRRKQRGAASGDDAN